MKLKLLCAVLCLFAGCLNTGCIVGVTDARKLWGEAGSESPKLVVKKTWSGFYAEAGTNFAGTLKADYDPETKAFKLDGSVNSDASPVIASNAELIRAMEATRAMDFASRTAIQGQVNEQLARVNSMIEHLGDKAAEVMPVLFPNGVGTGSPSGGGVVPTIESALSMWNSLPPEIKKAILDKAGLSPPVAGPPAEPGP